MSNRKSIKEQFNEAIKPSTSKPPLRVRTLADIKASSESDKPVKSFKDELGEVMQILNPDNEELINSDDGEERSWCCRKGCYNEITAFNLNLHTGVYDLVCDEHADAYWIDIGKCFSSVEELADSILHLQKKTWFDKALFWNMICEFISEGNRLADGNNWLVNNLLKYMKTWDEINMD